MVFIVLSWIFMVLGGFSRFSCFQLVFYDFSWFHWFFMVFHGPRLVFLQNVPG